MYVRTNQGLGQVPKAVVFDRPVWDGLFYGQSPGLGQPPLPHVTEIRFRNTGTTDPENCCANCSALLPATGGRLNLGVGLRGSGAVSLRAANGMELAFTISGHRPGIEYDITRTRRNSLWERRAGVWTRLTTVPMGTRDDRNDDDECLRLHRSNRIFAEDRPGWNHTVLPAPHDHIFTSRLSGPLVATHADAEEIVSRFSFAEWVIARSKAEGIPWTRLELPPFRDGTPRRFVFWHSTIWLTRNASHQWVLDHAHSEIARGPLRAAVVNSAPTP